MKKVLMLTVLLIARLLFAPLYGQSSESNFTTSNFNDVFLNDTLAALVSASVLDEYCELNEDGDALKEIENKEWFKELTPKGKELIEIEIWGIINLAKEHSAVYNKMFEIIYILRSISIEIRDLKFLELTEEFSDRVLMHLKMSHDCPHTKIMSINSLEAWGNGQPLRNDIEAQNRIINDYEKKHWHVLKTLGCDDSGCKKPVIMKEDL